MMGHRHDGPFNNLPRRERHSRVPSTPHNITTHFEGLRVDPSRPDISSGFFRSNNLRQPFPSHIAEFNRGPNSGLMDSRIGSTSQLRDALPFGRAMRKLHQQLQTSEEFYTSFQAEFDDEVARIKKYATSGMITGIWQSRVEGRRDPKIAVDGENEDEDVELREMKGRFADHQKDMHRALSVALSSTFILDPSKSNQNQIQHNSARLLYDKVLLANEHVRRLLRKATESREGCVMLLKEMVQLKRLVDPDDEENRTLFRQPKEDEDTRSTDGHGGWVDE